MCIQLNYRFSILLLYFVFKFSSFTFSQVDLNIGLTSEVIDGNYIGGLVNDIPTYNRKFSKVNHFVKNKSELLYALSVSKTGEIIYIKDKSCIDLTGETKIIIPSGVTLASGRGINGSKGALLFTKKKWNTPIISC